MRDQFKRYRYVILSALASWAVVALVCFATPVAFSGFLKEDSLAPFWYYISESGGLIGTSLLIILIGLGIAATGRNIWRKIILFFVAIIFLGALLGSLAWINEHVVKPRVEAQRPSHIYLGEIGVIDLNEFYGIESDSLRQAILEKNVKRAPAKVEHIYPAIAQHWVFESGYSFPSGHSQNAFLLATLVSGILTIRLRSRSRILLLIPFLWAVMVCISRVAIGIHTKYDVTAGAFIGLLIASLLLASGVLKRIFERE